MAAVPPTGHVERPALGWWIAVLSGMGILAVLALCADAYGWWAAHVTTALSRPLLQAILAAAVATHVGEGLVARRVARAAGFAPTANGWCVQTTLLGYPSLRLLLRQRGPLG